MIKYDTVIILSPAITLEEENISKYLIKDDPFEFRFKAVAKLQKLGHNHFLLVGGLVKNFPQISKPDVMEWILTHKYQIAQTALTKLVSEANTEGNAKKVQEFAKTNKLGRILLISNYWHLLRANDIFSDFTDLIFKPVPAESFVYDDELSSIQTFYNNQSFIASEIKGLSDRYRGQYKSGIS